MKILGIDPGTTESGWVIYDTENHSIIDKGISENNETIELIDTMDFDVMAIEMVASYGKPVGKETFETVYWIGRFAEKARSFGICVERYYKKTDINPAICFNSNVKDAMIRRALLDMFPKTGGGKEPSVGTKKQPGALYGINSHMFPALAVALTHALKNGLIEYKTY
jgi:Holliday junction resolvasome RuvABC endonuclease subunit